MCPREDIEPYNADGSWIQVVGGKEVQTYVPYVHGYPLFGHLKPGDGPRKIEITAKFAD